jgi:hypothetical protein
MEITTHRRRALSTALALLLAIESVSAVAAAAVVGRDSTTGPDTAIAGRPLPAALTPHAAPAAAAGAGAARIVTATSRSMRSATAEPADSAGAGPARTTAASAAATAIAARSTRAFADRAAVASVKKAKPAHRSGSSRSSGSSASSARSSGHSSSGGSHKGRNRFWFPSLGISRAVYSFPCSRTRQPDNIVYRWGCAGRNNVYLLGHAYGVFKPLHDAYVRGRLHAGMKAYYADSRGRTHTYAVRWWKLTRPTTSASWAWASQSVPSMTLQTCVGSNSQYRVMIRLVEVH